MIVPLFRLLATVLGFLLLLLIAVGGLVVAVFCLGGGTSTLSLSHLAELLSLPELRDEVGSWLASLEAEGEAAVVAALCGAGAVLLGLGLVVGALMPRRERQLVVERGPRGTITARRRAVGNALVDLAERPREILGTRARVRPNRERAGGRAHLRLTEAAGFDERPAAQQARADLERLAESLALKLQTSRRRPRRGGRAI